MNTVDLFAGPGGWDAAARDLGIDPLGVEFDKAACATRAAAGLRTLRADVGECDPDVFGPVDLLIASPPCQAFSMAGKGAGRGAVPVYLEAIDRWTLEAKPPSRDELDESCGDERAHLVLEPLRWALDLRPRYIALEQVPPVLPVWSAIARALERLGYSTWTGLLTAEQYGVPQTRCRAIMIADLEATGRLSPPPATHQRYIAPRGGDEATLGLFDPGEPERIIHPDDRDLLPWVSMAEALGWDPGDMVGFPRLADTPSNKAAGVITIRETDYRERDLRAASEPAFALTEKARSWQRWPFERPSTTVAGDSRIWPPGHKKNAEDERAGRDGYGDRAGTNAIRVTLEEALCLQSFASDYPVSGTKTKQFEQVGNAVPPLLARAILAHLFPGGDR